MTDFLSQPKKLQIELSSICNALCLGCHRTDPENYNRSKIEIPKNKIVSVETFDNLLSSKAMSSIDELEFCGIIDEPTLHPNFLKILQVARNKKDYISCIHTNGGTKTVDYWIKLSNISQTYNDLLILFNIDGLEDTNHIYRQNVKFDKVIENAKAFIDAGGRAQWQFLIFPWNKHQIDDAAKLSRKLGFENFVVRQDGSHITDEGLQNVLEKKKTNAREGKGIKPGIDPTIDTRYTKTQHLKIKCNSISKNMFFVSHDSRLWPCCFIPNGFYVNPKTNKYMNERIYKNYGKDFNDLTKYSADEIVAHPFYKNNLVESFNNMIGKGCVDKISRCVDTCTVKQLEKIPIGKIEEYVA